MMELNYAPLLYDPIYSLLGYPARLELENGTEADVIAIDDTSGVSVPEGGRISNFGLESIKPCASIRARELTANQIAPADLIGNIVLHYQLADEKTWRIESSRVMPSPQGELAGEVVLILTQTAE